MATPVVVGHPATIDMSIGALLLFGLVLVAAFAVLIRADDEDDK